MENCDYIPFNPKGISQYRAGNLGGCLQNEDRRPKTKDRRPKTEKRRPKNEDPNFFARIRHGQLKNQAKAFLSANRCENNGNLCFVEKTPESTKRRLLLKRFVRPQLTRNQGGLRFVEKTP